MSSSDLSPSCVHPESLVLIEAVPLCRIDVPEGLQREAVGDCSGDEAGGDAGRFDLVAPERPLRCAAVMSCAEAFALLEEVGHVAW